MDAETEIQVMRDVVKDGSSEKQWMEFLKSCIPYVANQKIARNMGVYWIFSDLYISKYMNIYIYIHLNVNQCKSYSRLKTVSFWWQG